MPMGSLLYQIWRRERSALSSFKRTDKKRPVLCCVMPGIGRPLRELVLFLGFCIGNIAGFSVHNEHLQAVFNIREADIRIII